MKIGTVNHDYTYSTETLGSSNHLFDALGDGIAEIDSMIATLARKRDDAKAQKERLVDRVASGKSLLMRDLRRIERFTRTLTRELPDEYNGAFFFVEAAAEFQAGTEFEMPDGDIWKNGKLLSTIQQRCQVRDREELINSAEILEKMLAVDWTREATSQEEQDLRARALTVIENESVRRGYPDSSLFAAIGIVTPSGQVLNSLMPETHRHLAFDAQTCWQRIVSKCKEVDRERREAKLRKTSTAVARAIATAPNTA